MRITDNARKIVAAILLIVLIVGCCASLMSCEFTGSNNPPDDDETNGNEGNGEGGDDPSHPNEEDDVGYWESSVSLGLVVEGGVITLAGKTYYGAGVNCYNLFNQCFTAMSAKQAKMALDVLKEYDVQVVRFNCGGYSYKDLDYYFNNKQAYLELLKEIADYAASLEIGLIPSLFWLYHAVPDYFDEPLKSWGKQDSQTIAFMKEYTTQIVSTISECKSVFAWEFGNEMNLICDLPNIAEHLPSLPQGSKRSGRNEQDYVSATDFNYAMTVFAETVRSLDDSGRMITSGNASLRRSQYNQLHYGTWTADTKEQYADITQMLNPGAMDCISEHTYFNDQADFDGTATTPKLYYDELLKISRSISKAYFVGEWGGGNHEIDYYYSIAEQLREAGVQLHLLWNFNLVENSIEYSFSADTERGRALLTLIAEMNAQYRRMQ